MSTTGAANQHTDRLADFTRDTRILILTLMACVIGAFTALIAYILVRLIALVTNLKGTPFDPRVATGPAATTARLVHRSPTDDPSDILRAFTCAAAVVTPTDGDWSLQNVILRNTPEASLMVRAGDVGGRGRSV